MPLHSHPVQAVLCIGPYELYEPFPDAFKEKKGQGCSLTAGIILVKEVVMGRDAKGWGGMGRDEVGWEV